MALAMSEPLNNGRLKGRLALITGASRGLGAALAVRFAEEGARLILMARTTGGLEKVEDRLRAASSEATLVPQDLTKGAAIDELGAALAQRFGRLDILIGNADQLGPLSPLAHIDPKRFEQALGLSAVTNYRLIRSLDPLLRASTSGRAIFVTADVARSPKPFWGAHAAGKAALEALVMTYAAETAKTTVRVNLVDPGPMRTQLRASAYPGEDKDTAPLPASRTEIFVDLAEESSSRHGERLTA
ncbi:MAG: SDR family NAD(P)-dependent oxidoreductase [Geminicoccaceae bacterium]